MKLADLVGSLTPELPSRKKRFVHDKKALDRFVKPYDAGLDRLMKDMSSLTVWTHDMVHERRYARNALRSISSINPEETLAVSEWIKKERPKTYRNYSAAFLGRLCEKCTGNVTLFGDYSVFGSRLSLGEKTVIVQGRVDILGQAMKSGTLVLNGSTERIGENCGTNAELIVHGNAQEVGIWMRGTVHIYGKLNRFDPGFTFGRIYVNDKEVYP